MIRADKPSSVEYQMRSNTPRTNEVAILMVGQKCGKMDIVPRRKDESLPKVAETHRAYDALQYPLMY